MASLALFLLALLPVEIAISERDLPSPVDRACIAWIAGFLLAVSMVRMYSSLLAIEKSERYHALVLGFLSTNSTERWKRVPLWLGRLFEWVSRVAAAIVIGIAIPVRLAEPTIKWTKLWNTMLGLGDMVSRQSTLVAEPHAIALDVLYKCLLLSAATFVVWDALLFFTFLWTRLWRIVRLPNQIPNHAEWWYIIVITDVVMLGSALLVPWVQKTWPLKEGTSPMTICFVVITLVISGLILVEMCVLWRCYAQAVKAFWSGLIGKDVP